TRASLAELLCEEFERLIPLGRDQLAVLADHRRAVAIGIVESLDFRLPGRAKRSAVHRMRRIAFELGGASVTRLRYHTTARRAPSARRCVVGRYTRNGVVRRYQIRDELLDSVRFTADGRRYRRATADDLEKVPALDPLRFCLGAHRGLSSGRRRSRSAP